MRVRLRGPLGVLRTYSTSIAPCFPPALGRILAPVPREHRSDISRVRVLLTERALQHFEQRAQQCSGVPRAPL